MPEVVIGREVKPEAATLLAINEIAPADAETFFVEIANDAPTPLALEGLVLVAAGDTGQTYVFPAQTLGPSQLTFVTQQQLGFRPAAGDQLFLYAPQEAKLIDARPVTAQLRGRSAEYEGRWLYPAEATPGEANRFEFHDQIVINEIMYNARPAKLSEPETPPTYENTMVLPMDATGWRYRETAGGLPADWANSSHPADGQQWLSGQGPLGYDQNMLDQLNTQVNFPPLENPPFITYYFEHDFDFSGSDMPHSFQLRHLIDGGAVFYLNGVQFHRFAMPAGPFDANTPGTAASRGAVLSDAIDVPADLMVQGTNRLSVEIHRPSITALKLVFGRSCCCARGARRACPPNNISPRTKNGSNFTTAGLRPWTSAGGGCMTRWSTSSSRAR